MTDATTLVLGLGNPLLGDDAIGWRVVEAVRDRRGDAPGVEVATAALGGLALMERMAGYRRVILVDAMTTGTHPPGTVLCFPLSDLPDRTCGHVTSAHDANLPTALAVGQRLGVPLPVEIHVVAVEAARIHDFTEALTPAVAAAIEPAVAAVLEILDR